MAGGIIGSIIASAVPGLLPSITETAKILVDRLVPDPAAREAAQRDVEAALTAREAAIQETIQQQNASQNAINLAEAQGNDRYSSRWRPTVGWVCVAAMAYNYVIAPPLTWFAEIIGTAFSISFPVPILSTMSEILPVLLALLGIGAQRTIERVQGVSTAAPAKR